MKHFIFIIIWLIPAGVFSQDENPPAKMICGQTSENWLHEFDSVYRFYSADSLIQYIEKENPYHDIKISEFQSVDFDKYFVAAFSFSGIDFLSSFEYYDTIKTDSIILHVLIHDGGSRGGGNFSTRWYIIPLEYKNYTIAACLQDELYSGVRKEWLFDSD